ncbi:LacI family DNA-binding transcriptional regulator [Paeniglutamicibacter terrestris]|uniref:LacI family transcriptional regulator n=1 Tax=Paeniglutamicibacter terrestris TaxID=2723403 RepID=A0ABX1G256_9MICC|nr:LacI family DNA-binding transcriptional regulator [Paeniglutamicibacter terrestris]NKG19846.1 LacI family transcriptional regulator [Paeniglutamicibacter terrestris]
MVVRLADVAREAGVSPATASRVLNGSSRSPAEAIAEKVRRAAERLGYFPNAQAQALARSSAGLVGLIVHDIADPYFSSIAHGVQHGLHGSGLRVMLSSTDRDGETEMEAVRAFMSYRTEGIVLAGSRTVDGDEPLIAAVETYRKNGGKVIMIGQPLPGTLGLSVDNRGSATELVRQLVELGHRRFVILAGDMNLVTVKDRHAGFIEGLDEAGLSALAVLPGVFTRDGGLEVMTEYLDASGAEIAQGQICVLAANDVMALGALTAVRRAGLRVPQDVALAGFDDIATLEDMIPSITTVQLPLDSMGEQAALMLLGAEDAASVRVIDGTPVLRESTTFCP